MAKKYQPIYLGDPEFSSKMMKVYVWIMPFVFIAMAILLLVNKAWLSSGIFLVLALICLPTLSPTLKKFKIEGLTKFILCVVLVIAALYSTGLYL